MEDVFKANPGAILGASWGQVTSTSQQRNQRSQTLTTNLRSPSLAPSVSASVPSSVMSQDADYDDDNDSDYAPVTMSSWGNQNEEGTIDTSAWRTLVDPNFQIRADGVGSGNLHRKKSSRYQPVDEEAIIQARLYNKPLNTGKSKKSKKSSSKKSSSLSPAVRLPPGEAAGAWGRGELLSKPFWDQQPSSSGNTFSTRRLYSSNQTNSNFDINDMYSSFSSPPSYYNQHQHQRQENELYHLHVPLYDFPTSQDHQFGRHDGQPMLIIKTEFAPGITNEIRIWKGDDLDQIVEHFLVYHHLNVTEEARGNMTDTLRILVDGCVNKQTAAS